MTPGSRIPHHSTTLISLTNFNISVLSTNANFLMVLAGHPEFMVGDADTEFNVRHKEMLFRLCVAVLATVLSECRNRPAAGTTGHRRAAAGSRDGNL